MKKLFKDVLKIVSETIFKTSLIIIQLDIV